MGISPDIYAPVLCDISRSYLDAQRHASHLAVRELEARALLRIIDRDADTRCLERRLYLMRLVEHALLLLLDGHDGHLRRRYERRELQPRVVSVHHDDGADDPRRKSPRGLMDVFELVVPVGELDIESSGKAVSEVVARARLQCLAVMHECLYRICRDSSCESLLLGLLTSDDGYGKELLDEVRIYVEHLYRALL